MRIDKYISEAAQLTRTEARTLLRAGRVQANGMPITDPAAHIDPNAALVSIDGASVAYQRHFHIMLNKPAGVITAASDARARTVLELLPDSMRVRRDLAPVGRLDKDTTGLLIITTDGQLAHRLISPKFHVDKEYIADVAAPITPADIQAVADGLPLSDFTARPAALIPDPDNRTRCRLILQEGKYHQVKRMLAALGKPVLALHRHRFGPLTLDPSLTPAAARPLTAVEAEALYNAAGLR